MLKRLLKKLRRNVREGNERGARENVIEDLFYDFHRSRAQIYKMNFIRGIFFGFGSVLGGTLVVTLLIWILTGLGHIFPPLGQSLNGVSETIEQKPQ